MAATRGQVWRAELDPTRGHEQSGSRPCLVVSVDQFNRGPAGLVVIVPLTTRHRPLPLRVAIDPPEGGLSARSFAMCEQIRSVSVDRLVEEWGVVSPRTLQVVEDRLRILLGL